MKDDLIEKHVLVVGGTSGTGKTLVKTLAKTKGCLVSVVARRPYLGDKEFTNVLSWPLDLTETNEIPGMVGKIIKGGGKLTNIIFCQRYRGENDPWENEIKASLTATHRIIENASPHFNATQESSIVVLSSLSASMVMTEQPVSYHVAKAGLVQMVRYYAHALGPKGIRVNAISSGVVVKDENRDFYDNAIGLKDLFKKIIPLNRMGTSEDIISAILFLCSKESSFITGQNLTIDGGVSLSVQESLARELTSFKHPQSRGP